MVFIFGYKQEIEKNISLQLTGMKQNLFASLRK